jgi:hypothetical protein
MIGFQRTLAGLKKVCLLASEHSACAAPAICGVAHDLFDRSSASGLREDIGARFFPTQICFVLKMLGCGEKRRIDGRGVDRNANLTHRLADGVEESATGVLHQMPTISDLGRLRERLGGGERIAAASILSG